MDKEGETIMHIVANAPTEAVESEDVATSLAHCIKSVNKIDMDMRNLNGRTPLIVACCNGNKSLVEFLIHSGANLNAEDNFGYLFCACFV